MVADGLVSVDCKAEYSTGFFELAEEVEERKVPLCCADVSRSACSA